MKRTSNHRSKNNSMLTSVVIGILAALIVSITGAVLGTTMVNTGKIQESAYSVISVIVWVVSSLIGTFLAAAFYSEQKLLASVIVALGYLLIIAAIQIMIFDSQFDNVWKGLLSITAGMLPAILLNRTGTGRKRSKIKYHKI